MANIARQVKREMLKKEKAFAADHPQLMEKAKELGRKGFGTITAPCQCTELHAILMQFGFSTGSVMALSKAWSDGFFQKHSESTISIA